MSEENIFDLTAIIGANNDKQIRKNIKNITEDDKEDMLIGYQKVPKSEWKDLKYYTHIRYEKNDGSFMKGGFIKNVWKNNDENKIKIELTTNFNSYNAFVWSINLNNIKNIWKRNDNPMTNNNSNLTPLTERVEKLEMICSNIVKEIQNNNNEQKRILNLIAKLNNKISKK